MSNNLNVQQLTTGQTNKEAGVNTATGQIDAAVTEILSIDLTAGNASLTAAQLRGAVKFLATLATTAGRSVTFGTPVKRGIVMLENDAATSTQNVDFKCGTTTVTLAPGGVSLVQLDGTANGMRIVAGNGSGLPSGGVLGQALIKNSGTSGDASFQGNALTGGSLNQVLTKLSSANYDWAWQTPTGGGGGSGAGTIAARPVVVQSAVITGATGTITLGAAPTPGNLLVVLGSHWNILATFQPRTAGGWVQIYANDGTTADGEFVFVRRCVAGDTAAQQFTTNTGGVNAAMFEITSFDPLSPFDYVTGFHELTGTTQNLVGYASQDTSLMIGMFGTTGSSSLPTVTGSTTSGPTSTGNAGSNGNPRGVTAFTKTQDSGNSTITGTWAGSVTSYGVILTLRPKVVQSANYTQGGLVLRRDAFNPPTVANFGTTVNLNSATGVMTEVPGVGTVMEMTTLVAGDQFHLRLKAAPSGKVVTVKLAHDSRMFNFAGAGIALRNSGTGKFTNVGLHFNATLKFSFGEWNAGTFSAEPLAETITDRTHVPINWIRADWSDNTNIIYYISGDGYTWHPIFSRPLATFISSIDQVGIYVFNNNAAGGWPNFTGVATQAKMRSTFYYYEDSDIPAANLLGGNVQYNIATVSGTTDTLALADVQKLKEYTNAAAAAVTIPLNSSVAFPIGTWIDICAMGVGGVTVAGTGGVTLRGTGTIAQYARKRLHKRGTDEWVIA